MNYNPFDPYGCFWKYLAVNLAAMALCATRVAVGLLDVRAGGGAGEVDELMKPHGVQLSRKKGWRMPSNTISVARPGKWGNPTKVGPGETAHYAISCFRDFVRDNADYVAAAKKELRGKNLACWCPLGAECHRDVLLEISNS